jgi:hypothetical protein
MTDCSATIIPAITTFLLSEHRLHYQTGDVGYGGFDGRFCGDIEFQFHSRVDGCIGEGCILDLCLIMSAIGSHGGKDITKVIAITKGSVPRDNSNR